MPQSIPKLDLLYCYVRIVNDIVEAAALKRCSTGETWCQHGQLRMSLMEKGAWKTMIAYLEEQGFTELSKAKEMNMVALDWTPHSIAKKKKP